MQASQTSGVESTNVPGPGGPPREAAQQNLADAKTRLLLSADQGDLNLKAVRARAEDFRRSLGQVAFVLQHRPQDIKWIDLLDRYSLLSTQHRLLQEQIRPALKRFIVHPKSVNQQNAPMLPIMMATKILPEMETEHAQQAEKHQQAMGALSTADQMAALQAAFSKHNQLVDDLCAKAGPLSTESLGRLKLGRSAVAAATSSGPAKSSPAQTIGVKRKLEGPALLVAAALTGEGL